MIRAAFIGAALVGGALSAGAQTPAPTPPPATPRAEKTRPAEPTPAPKARGRLDELLPGSDFEIPVVAPLPPMEPLGAMELEPMIPREPFGAGAMLYFDATPAPDLMHLSEPFFSLDAMPTLEAFDALEPMVPLEPMMPLEPLTPLGHFDFDTPVPSVPAVPPVPAISGFYEMPVTPDVAHAPAIARGVPGQSQFERQFGDLTSEPMEAWAQADPADSLYRLARQTLNRGEYRRAAQLFGDIGQRYPNSAYAADARYWKAFALYRIGGASDLREALTTLDTSGRRYYQASLQADAATLASRIRGALAQLGDAQALHAVAQAAGEQGAPCDKEDAAVRTAALNALGDMDYQSTTPIFKRILAKRDACSASLRRNALFMLAKRGDPEATSLIIASARNDTDPHVRSEALRWLARMPNDEALATLEEIVRTPGNESQRQSAIAALARSDRPRALQAIKNIIERGDVSESLRYTALTSLSSDETNDGGAYLRSVYPRLESTRLKLGAIRGVARIGGTENARWLLSIVRNQNEPLDVRSAALTYAGRSEIAIADLVSMYDAAADRPLRMRLVSLYGQRTEPQAADKLVTIAKTGTDPEMRRMAISALSRKNDPRTRQLLLEILDK